MLVWEGIKYFYQDSTPIVDSVIIIHGKLGCTHFVETKTNEEEKDLKPYIKEAEELCSIKLYQYLLLRAREYEIIS